jgi:predicted RNase H-like HicB family nuclease
MPQYIALIRKDPDSDYGVEFPDFPGCFSAGSTLDEVKDMAQEALQGHAQLLLEEGQELPPPSSLEALLKERRHREAVALMVEVKAPPRRAVRVNVTLDETLLEAIDVHARALGKTRSAFLAEAARHSLGLKAGPSRQVHTIRKQR